MTNEQKKLEQELIEYHRQGLVTVEEMVRLAEDERYWAGLKSADEAHQIH